MEKTTTTRIPARRAQLVAERDRLVAELRFRPANGVPAREVGGRFISSAEVAERVEAISRLNAAIKAAEMAEKDARAKRASDEARREADFALKARKGQQRAAKVAAAYIAPPLRRRRSAMTAAPRRRRSTNGTYWWIATTSSSRHKFHSRWQTGRIKNVCRGVLSPIIQKYSTSAAAGRSETKTAKAFSV